MAYVLVIITVFTTTAGVATDTRFQEFDTRDACETASAGVQRGVADIGGTIGRYVFSACYPKG